MKRILSLVLLFAALTVHADEGMWTLYNLPEAVYKQMQAEGFSLPQSKLYQDSDAICRSVVNFGNFCSGVVVSPDGLVFTNHHCGFEAIRSHSTVEHDYMLNGFCAKSYEEELPNEDLFVSFMVAQKDITPILDSLGYFVLKSDDQEEVLNNLEDMQNKVIKADDSTLRAEILPFFEGNKYFMTIYRDYSDVRLVFTVPQSMGKFGGETDNWMWPRQTCDYSVFRIYTDSLGNPAKYSEKNVPMHPKAWARVSLDGYKQGDFAMTMGYPGTTERYLSSYGIQEMHDCVHEPRIKVRGIRQEIMRRHMRADEAIRIMYDSKYAQSSNYWKNAIGMNKCIDSIGIVRQKEDLEDKIQMYKDTTGYLKDKLDFITLLDLYTKRARIMKPLNYFFETFQRGTEVGNRALKFTRMEVKGPDNNKKKHYVQYDDNSDTWDEATEKEILVALLKNYRESVDEEWLPDFYKTIDKKFKGDYNAYVEKIFAKSVLMKKDCKIYYYKKSVQKDLGIKMAYDLIDILGKMRDEMQPINEQIALQEHYLCAVKVRMEEDMPHYSDANFTMRLSYGQVGGYDINGYDSGYYTTAESIVEKMKQGDEKTADAGKYNFEYFAEPVMHELMSAKDFGQYADKTTGKLQLCFLTNNDITGGNSGSPMFNGKGELIGLAFDGNWDSLASDIFFDTKLARCIGVDIRYVVYMMDKWGHADRLVSELLGK